MYEGLPAVQLVRRGIAGDLAFWAPLVGSTLEREPVVEQYLRNLVVGRGRSERTTKSYAGWLVPAIQYRRIKEQSWESFAADMDEFLLWRRALRRANSGRGMAGPSRQTLQSMMTAISGLYRFGVLHELVSRDVMSLLFEVTDELGSPVHLRAGWSGGPELRLRSRYVIRSGTTTADRQVRQHREQRRPVTAEEFALLIGQVTSARDAFCLALMRYCALRVGQVVTLKRDRIHAMPDAVPCPSRRMGPHLHVEPAVDHPHHDGVKRRDPFAVPMGAAVVQLWWAWLEERAGIRGATEQPWLLLAFAGPLGREGQALGSSAVREMVKVVAKRAGLRHITPHLLRHGFGQEAADVDMPPDLLQRLLGHASIESQTVYRQTSDEAVAAAVLRLENARQVRIENR
ncbi:tyrosine-type recombinase/integrase [Actinoplanes aureus]|uniref:Site-specific integrase n=1 Tax=Actinoplanes aureus TaxID=2792083 RepID=A0A931CF98_9ACTN|nr:site-specific integrase [Actinoplanes aureus]MBG0568805.1 site-specific integrase [Actinoplanes aureus]